MYNDSCERFCVYFYLYRSGVNETQRQIILLISIKYINVIMLDYHSVRGGELNAHLNSFKFEFDNIKIKTSSPVHPFC